MRVPIYVPLLFVVAAIALLGFDIFAIVGASQSSHVQYVEHSDDNLTFVASVQRYFEPGMEIRTPGQRIIAVDVAGPTSTGGAVVHGVDPALAAEAQFTVIPSWQVGDLRANGTADVLHQAEAPFAAQTYPIRNIPADASLAWHPGLVGRETVTLVWLVRNTSDDYPRLAQELLENGIEGRGEKGGEAIIAVDSFVMERDPWLRAVAAICALAAIVLAVLPRVRMLPRALPSGAGGASIGLAEAGAAFLASLRNAYLALAVAVALLGVPLIMALALFAGQAPAGDAAFGEPRGQPFLGWQGTMWNLLIMTLAAGILASARPALEAHLALRRWRRHEASPPIEGELAD